MNQKKLFNQFEVLESLRDIRGKKHKLIAILIMIIHGTLCGFTVFFNKCDFFS